MAENTTIAWADDSVSFWWGCHRYGPGCVNCYAEALAKRLGRDIWGKQAPRLLVESAAKVCRRLNTKAERNGEKRVVFVNSMSDFFEDHGGQVINRRGEVVRAETSGGKRDWNTTLADLRRDAFGEIDGCQSLRFLFLTKRPENILPMWPAHARYPDYMPNADMADPPGPAYYRHNCWLGTSIANQQDVDRNIPFLMRCRNLTPVLFLSIEPMIGPVCLDAPQDGWLTEFTDEKLSSCRPRPAIDFVIVGGESGPRARPCEVRWIRSIVDQCREAGVPCFVKQMGSHAIATNGEAAKGWRCPTVDGRLRLKDKKGEDPLEWPEDLRVRQFPSLEAAAR